MKQWKYRLNVPRLSKPEVKPLFSSRWILHSAFFSHGPAHRSINCHLRPERTRKTARVPKRIDHLPWGQGWRAVGSSSKSWWEKTAVTSPWFLWSSVRWYAIESSTSSTLRDQTGYWSEDIRGPTQTSNGSMVSHCFLMSYPIWIQVGPKQDGLMYPKMGLVTSKTTNICGVLSRLIGLVEGKQWHFRKLTFTQVLQSGINNYWGILGIFHAKVGISE